MTYSCHFVLLSGAFRSHLMVSAFAQDEAPCLAGTEPSSLCSGQQPQGTKAPLRCLEPGEHCRAAVQCFPEDSGNLKKSYFLHLTWFYLCSSPGRWALSPTSVAWAWASQVWPGEQPSKAWRVTPCLGHPSGGPAASRVWQRLWLQGLQITECSGNLLLHLESQPVPALRPPVGGGGVRARWALLPLHGFYSSRPSRPDVWLGDAERPLRRDPASLG